MPKRTRWNKTMTDKSDNNFIKTQEVMFNNIATYEQQCDVSPTNPLLHQTARFLYVREGEGVIKIKQELYNIERDSLVVLMPWQVSEIVEVKTPLFYDLITFNFTFLDYLLKHNLNYRGSQDQLRDTLYGISCVNLDPAASKYVSYIFNEIALMLECKQINNVSAQVESAINNHSFNRNYRSTYLGIPSGRLNVLQEVSNYSLNIFQSEAQKELVKADHKSHHNVWETIRLTAKMIDLLAFYMQLATSREAVVLPADTAPSNYNSRSIFQYIYNNLIYHPSIEDVAGKFMMSSSTLDRYIRKTTGETFASLTKTMKVIKTIDYIIYTEFTLDEIAHLMGYTDASYISKLVFERTGKHTQDIRNDSTLITLVKHDRNLQLAKKIENYLYEHFSEEVSASLVATIFDISVNQLNTILQVAYERNFYDLLMYIRLTKASVLLTTTDLDVMDISYRVGFNSTKTFVRNFIKAYDITPSKFRNKTILQDANFTNEMSN